MTSKIVVNNIEADTGVSTVTFNSNVSAPTFSGNVNASSGVTTITTLRATSIVGVTTAGITTAYIGAINDGPISGARNRIINGDMRIDQRNAGASVNISADSYTLDRWLNRVSGGGVITVQRSTTVPVGFTSSINLTVQTVDSSIAAGDIYELEQRIEGFNSSDLSWGTSSAKPVTISFWVQSSVTGTYGFGVSSSSYTRFYVSTYTINSANTWQQISITIPGDTGATQNISNGIGISIHFDLGSGTSQNATAGSWNTSSGSWRTSGCVNWIANTSATFYITGVQLEAGTVATPFERRSYGQELSLCQRYCYATYAPGVTGSANQLVSLITGSTTRIPIPATPVQMRGTPSLTVYTNASGGGSGTLVEFSSATNKTVSSTNINGPCGGGYHDITSLSNPVYYDGLFTAEL
jgi:hypothetical protein